MNEYLKKVEEGIQAQSFARMMGLHAEDAGEGYAVISCEKRDDLLQQTGMMHGGVTGAVCEAACDYAALTVLPDGQSLIGVEYKINFLRGITTDKVIAKATVIKQGRKLLVIEADALNEGSNKIAAKMLMTGTPVQG